MFQIFMVNVRHDVWLFFTLYYIVTVTAVHFATESQCALLWLLCTHTPRECQISSCLCVIRRCSGKMCCFYRSFQQMPIYVIFFFVLFLFCTEYFLFIFFCLFWSIDFPHVCKLFCSATKLLVILISTWLQLLGQVLWTLAELLTFSSQNDASVPQSIMDLWAVHNYD